MDPLPSHPASHQAAQPPQASPVALPKKDDKIIPTSWRVSLVVGVIFGACLVVLGVYLGNGTLSAPGWLTSAVKGLSYIVAGAQVLSIPFLIAHYFTEKKAHNRGHLLAHPASDGEDSPLPSPRSATSAAGSGGTASSTPATQVD